MNLKKYLIKVIAIVLFLILAIAQCSCIYAQETKSQYFGIIPLMNNEVGYSINKPDSDGASKIWNIVKFICNNFIY